MSTRMTVAVTGALGFVASHLLPRLEAGGARVIAIARPGRDVTAIERVRIEVRRADLSDRTGLASAFTGADAVVHLAGMALVPGMLPALVVARVSRGVFIGSAGVYTKLASPGAEAKRAGEAGLRASPLAYTLLRPSMIYGTPRDRNLARLLRWIRRCPVVPIPGGGATPQQPVHVEDLCAAIVAALERPAAARGEYDVGGPEAIELREMIHLAGHALGRRVWLMPVPLGPGRAAAVLARRLGLPFPVSPEQVLRLQESKAVNIAPARRDLGFAPRPFAQGIAAEARLLWPEEA